MNCKYCNREIIVEAPYCPWCGKRIRPLCPKESLLLAKHLGRSSDADFTRARAIYLVYQNGLYFPQYANIEEYGVKELRLGRAMTQNYKVIGRDFVDDYGNLLFIGGKNWTIGQVNELKSLSLRQVNRMIADGIINDEMQCNEIRAAIKDA